MVYVSSNALLYILLAFFAHGTRLYALQSSRSDPSKQVFGEAVSGSNLRFDWDEIKYVYAFGDSYTFVQGTQGLANFSFIGDLQNLNFTKGELLSDEIIFRNTSSDGANWIEFLTGCFSGKPNDCSPRQLWDFAFAGADIDGSLCTPTPSPIYGPPGRSSKAMGVVCCKLPASSDEAYTYCLVDRHQRYWRFHGKYDCNAFYSQEMDSLFSTVELAHSAGLNGAHLFLTVPPEERSPSGLASSRAALQKANIIEYNAQLISRAKGFATNHTDTPVFVFDAHKWFNFILDNAAQFGFENTTGYCECTDPSFFWYNTGHPTEHTHRLLAGALGDFLSSISA